MVYQAPRKFGAHGGLGIQLNRLSDEQLLVWKPMMRSLVITVYQDSKSHPLKGLAIKQATELGIREKTQEVTPIQQAIMINDMMDQVPGVKDGVNKLVTSGSPPISSRRIGLRRSGISKDTFVRLSGFTGSL